MRVAIRADASVTIGSGHVMRCLTLAEALRAKGGEVVFLCRETEGHLGVEISQRGFTLEWLNEATSGSETDAADCLAVLGSGVDLLVVDHYGLDLCWEKLLRDKTRYIMVIDDLANRAHDCDLLLDQNLLPDMDQRYDGLVPQHCRLLLGPQFALLRNEFHYLAKKPRERSRVGLLLIFFGGSDSQNLTALALREIAEIPLAADVVIGGSNPHRSEIETLCGESNGKWTLHVQTGRMAELMANADLALGAGGSSHWERCRLGLPAIVVTVADNQVETTRLLHEKGVCRWLGDAGSLPPGIFRDAVADLIFHPQKLSLMSKVSIDLMAQHVGTSGVVTEILELLGSDSD